MKTDKTINGIDVSKCIDFIYPTGCNSKNTNCYYKQLKRKEQECKDLKNDYAELEKRHNDSFEQFKNLKMICDDYKIANAELEKENEELLKFKEKQKKRIVRIKKTIRIQRLML